MAGETGKLLRRLTRAGLPVSESIQEAMLAVEITDYTDYDPTPFWHDRPLVFLETPAGGVKTISAPHMVVTLLHHLELDRGHEVLVLGAKGGYLAAVISEIVGPEGGVTVVDPSRDVIDHVRERLNDNIPANEVAIRKMRTLERAPPNLPDPLNRVLVTGSLPALPRWLEERVAEGGFVIAPLGGRVSQRLVKRERQNEWFDTDLGGVLFGPVDIAETEVEAAGPQQLAELFEEALEIGVELGVFGVEDRDQLLELADSIRNLPECDDALELNQDDEVWDDENPFFLFDEEIDIDEHPLMQLLSEAADWLTPLWPTLIALFDAQMQHPGAPEAEDDDLGFGRGHADLVP